MAARAFLLWDTLVHTSDMVSLRTFCKLKFSWRFGVGRCLILHELSFLPSHFSFSFVTVQLYEELKIFSFCPVKKWPYKPTPTFSKHQVLKLDHWNGVAKSPFLWIIISSVIKFIIYQCGKKFDCKRNHLMCGYLNLITLKWFTWEVKAKDLSDSDSKYNEMYRIQIFQLFQWE